MDSYGKRIIYIHRGRNKKAVRVGKLFTSQDYNFDFRGKNRVLLLLKAWITAREIPQADIYFVEGGLCFWPAWFLKKRFPTSKIILRAMDPLFYLDPRKKTIATFFYKWRMKQMKACLDGMIAVSEMIKNDALKWISCPIKVVPNFIIDIERFKPSHSDSQNTLVFVCERPLETGYVKGLDRVIDIFQQVKKKVPDTELILVGSGTENLNYNIEGIEYLGYQEIEKVYQRASITILPARYDAFPLVVGETILSGVIPIVSDHVGSQALLTQHKDKLVVNGDDSLEPFVSAVCHIMSLSTEQRKNILNDLTPSAADLSEDHILGRIKDAWDTLLKEI
ncbi:MAG: glycosyltransferase family 4 protein [Candidatus Margulisbacteria bacterium]|nr:glycosyltransferase family 4 protein [Candidatus Margulisiibacteriota bacterium]